MIDLARLGPAQRDAAGHSARKRQFRQLVFRHSRELPAQHNAIVMDGSTVELELGQAMLDALETGIRDIERGDGDYCIGTTPPLWFWWYCE